MVLNAFKRFDRLIEKMSSIGLVISVFIILFFALANIVGRWMEMSLMWIDPLIRHLVFLCTFLGGVIATGRGTHVGIDVVSKFLEKNHLPKIERTFSIIILVVCVLTLLWLIYASCIFLKTEFEFGKPQFLGIHSAYLVSIIPFGFSLIAYRFFYKLLVTIFKIDKDQAC